MIGQASRAANEKTYELSGAVEVILGLSKEVVGLLKKIDASCGSSLAGHGVERAELQ